MTHEVGHEGAQEHGPIMTAPPCPPHTFLPPLTPCRSMSP